jgi:hypothetical protein
LAAAATALGLTSVVADIVSNVLGVMECAEEIRAESYYFLWKVKEGSK